MRNESLNGGLNRVLDIRKTCWPAFSANDSLHDMPVHNIRGNLPGWKVSAAFSIQTNCFFSSRCLACLEYCEFSLKVSIVALSKNGLRCFLFVRLFARFVVVLTGSQTDLSESLRVLCKLEIQFRLSYACPINQFYRFPCCWKKLFGMKLEFRAYRGQVTEQSELTSS